MSARPVDRSARHRPPGDPGAGGPAAPSVPGSAAAPTLADVPALVSALEAAGHPARWSVTPEAARVDPEVSRAAYRIVEVSIDVICRLLPAGQNLSMRARVDGSDLILSVQSMGLEGLGQRGLVPEADRAIVRARVREAHGRLALRRTASGNWLGVITLPL